jgi:ATP-dependent DNA helicase PIF1
MPNIIEATILTGSAKGEDMFIPRIPLIPSDMPFDFKRLQYPVRLSFAMSINKAQGQSLSVADVNVESSCFSHGQLYVACSRVGTPRRLYIFAPGGQTINVVYQKALE